MVNFDKVWGSNTNVNAGNGGPTYLDADDLRTDRPDWREAKVTNVKRSHTQKGHEFLWLTFRSVDGNWFHRQAYFHNNDIRQLTAVVGIPEGISNDEQIIGKQCWVLLTKQTSNKDNRIYVKIVRYSVDNPLADSAPPNHDDHPVDDQPPF